jgi:integrase
LAERQPELAKLTFDNLLKKKINEPIFKLKNGETTNSLNGTFRTLMRDSGLDKNKKTHEKRTLYSLRHTYAHFALLQDKMDVYTLAKQMGTSVKMIEMHYGHLNPAMKADVIAGKRKGVQKNVIKNEKTNDGT